MIKIYNLYKAYQKIIAFPLLSVGRSALSILTISEDNWNLVLKE